MVLKVDIKDYIDLYNTGHKMDSLKPLHNQTYQIFKSSYKTDIRVVDRREIYNNPLAFDKVKHFINSNPYFYMIPLTTPKGTIKGFIVRGVLSGDYNTVTDTSVDYEKKVPLMFGFDDSFKKYNEAEQCYPIIVCEGCKDCLTLKKFYPYSLSNNTNEMGLNAHILRNISNRFILSYDNDSAGRRGMEKDKRILRGLGAYVDTLSIPEGYKDCTDFIIAKDGSLIKGNIEYLRSQIRKKVRGLMSV